MARDTLRMAGGGKRWPYRKKGEVGVDELIAKIKNLGCDDYRVATTYLLRWLIRAAEEE